jgi:hypothetical protein
MVTGSASQSTIASRQSTKLSKTDKKWNAHLQKINFVDEAPQSSGSKIYHALIPNPDAYIRSVAREVMRTLYFSPDDSIPMLNTLDYVIHEDKGISAKDGGNGHVKIFYSTNHVEKSFANNDTAKVDFETRGVLSMNSPTLSSSNRRELVLTVRIPSSGSLLKVQPMPYAWQPEDSMERPPVLRAGAIPTVIVM